MRRGDWETALNEEVAKWQTRRFAWARADCATFAAACVKVMTGDDPLKAERKQYKGKQGGLRMLAELPLTERLDEKFERVALAFAQRGDLAMDGEAVGVVWGADALFLGRDGGQAGLVRVPRAAWTGAWRVG